MRILGRLFPLDLHLPKETRLQSSGMVTETGSFRHDHHVTNLWGSLWYFGQLGASPTPQEGAYTTNRSESSVFMDGMYGVHTME